MSVNIVVPAMGESVTEATVSRILCPSGTSVRKDQEVLELETEKVNQVLYAPAAGIVTVKVTPGQTVRVGEILGTIAETAEAPAPVLPPHRPPPAPSTAPVRISVEQAVQQAPRREAPPPPSGPRTPMSRLRKTIAERLVEVKNRTAMLTTFNEVDMSRIMEIRHREQEGFQKRYGVKLGFMSFFVKATVSALKAFPQLHAFIEGDDIVQFPNYDISVAVSTDRGLLVPVVRACDQASFGQIEQAILTCSTQAREGTLSLDALRGGSFTITNGGVFGSLLSTPILNPPQSGILGMHTIVKRPVVVDDAIVIRPMMYLALSYDHRLVDGREAVQFLSFMKQHLEDPSRLLLEL